ncbi:U-box domain-containing protein 33 [Acorus gramineus]|uniref:RING-type E3 ubiquitin transferase n=1 Tax=Acorus gramineus TaxID=55184 RepID=A0AAV9B5G9_ACOGR|nr:U-box domain-containing protein 33 [Acorus gramineus]
MELLRPSPPNHHHSAADLRHSLGLVGPNLSADGGAGRIHVAVGKSMEKTLALLIWTFRRFACREITLLHVHRPSPTIPTLLGNLPATQGNEEMVSAHRSKEKEQTERILLSYLSICSKAQVQASVVFLESAHVPKGIVDLLSKHGVRKLVMGAKLDNCMKVNRRSSKATYTAKNAPPFSEIWFVSGDEHIWTREAYEDHNSLPTLCHPIVLTKRSWSDLSLRRNVSVMPAYDDMGLLGTESSIMDDGCEMGSQSSTSSKDSEPFSYAAISMSSEYCIKDEDVRQILSDWLEDARKEFERSKIETFTEQMKCKESEFKALEIFNRIRDLEVARLCEVKRRNEIEDALKTAKQEQEVVTKQRDEALRELKNAMTTATILESHVHEAAHRRDEATEELKLIQASIAALQFEKQKIRQQREEAFSTLERWRTFRNMSQKCDKFTSFTSDIPEFVEFSYSDLQIATCDFSESFKIGQGANGCVYKGEMLGRTVAVKKLRATNMQGWSEFQQEVHVLSNMRHPHLVTLIGVCPEACSLVYEYFPNGSLQDHLFHNKTGSPPLTWKTRARIASETSRALLFLHTSKPEKIIHGDLKLKNIFLDSNFNCKIGDFGICRLMPEECVDLPIFRRNTELKGSFRYTDPESQRTGELTPKSDVYSFGIIVLQLLTGRPPIGLIGDVKRATMGGRLSSILDPSAGDWPMPMATGLAELGLRCSEMNARDRPELTPSMVREVEQLHVAEERPVPAFFMCPIFQEIMHDPQVAADGFTYEGEAIRGWLENGRETSPMTNLKLNHLDLIPNHALRFAIHDWLCQFSQS